MSGLVGFLFCILSLIAWPILAYDKRYLDVDPMAGHRSIVEGFGLGPAPFPDYKDMNFELFGSAYLEGDSVKITSPTQHQKGAIWSKSIYDVSVTNDFQLDLSFRVGGVDGTLFGDGFGLWFVDKAFRGMGGDALGGPDWWRGVGIFFDTFSNHHLKGKKHPYVYGIDNDGNFNYNDLTAKDVQNHGCHIPLRSLEDGVLESTNVRITYSRNKVSVSIQPYDAGSDWLKCFQMTDVTLPNNIYVGLTAMTGEVVDKHSMISLQMYNKIVYDAWRLGIDYKQHQMPSLWEEMKHSGAIAKEFEEWEREIEEEVDEFNLASKYQDYYYFQYADNYYRHDYYADPESYGDREDYYEEREVQYEKPSLKNNYQKKKPKGSKSKTETIELTDDEIMKIESLIAGTEIATEIGRQAEDRMKRLRKLRKHMEAEFEENLSKVNQLVKEVKRKEYDLNRRIDRIANKLDVRIKRIVKRSDRNRGYWKIPFGMILLVVVVATGFGYYGYQKHMKKHLL